MHAFVSERDKVTNIVVSPRMLLLPDSTWQAMLVHEMVREMQCRLLICRQVTFHVSCCVLLHHLPRMHINMMTSEQRAGLQAVQRFLK